MKIKDILNRDIVNLTNCDQEPIHIPGSIQPHGFLVALNDAHEIEYCSENVFEFTGMSHTELLKQKISVLVKGDNLPAFMEYLFQLSKKPGSPLPVVIGNKSFNCTIHRHNGLTIVDCEPATDALPDASAVYDQTVQFLKYMQETTTLQELCNKIAIEIKELTGYDRVMVYRFDKFYNGEVYAESKREDLESFLGLHYPHTDIPIQARQLYIKNLLRIIVDINYTPVPIYTIDDVPGKNLDLSFSVLRSTSPMHVQYLQNMGVGATLTISLLQDGKLWGLVACHHYSRKYLDHYTRINALLQGHFLTSQIKIRQTAEEYTVAKEVNVALEKMLNQVFPPERSSFSTIISQPALLQLCNAGGVAIVMDNVVYRNGNTPSDDDIHNIIQWAIPHSMNRVLSTSKLVDQFPAASEICPTASGLIFYSFNSFHNGCVVWFNPETLEEVKWAGDPEKAIEKDENGLSPRKSFEGWKVIVKCQAREWKEPELNAAANYAYALQKHITLVLLNEEDMRQRSLSEQLKNSNAELENINWISTHDLKEPLRKIQVFSSKLLMNENEFAGDNAVTLQKINASANRMQRLIEGLSLYAKARQSKENFLRIDLQDRVSEIVAELQDEVAEKNAEIVVGGLPIVHAIPVLIQQLFVNLINNSLKFSRKNESARIEITGGAHHANHKESPDKFSVITVKDNGIGFSPAMNEQVFKIFSRLNPVNEYEGSGIGLALCKKIMQLHHGYIEAKGEVDKGAEFILYFPANDLTI